MTCDSAVPTRTQPQATVISLSAACTSPSSGSSLLTSAGAAYSGKWHGAMTVRPGMRMHDRCHDGSHDTSRGILHHLTRT